MSEPHTSDEDRAFEALFRPLSPPLADEDFVERVMRRIKRRIWIRRIVLASAVAAGLAFAIMPISQTAISISEALLAAAHWRDGLSFEQHGFAIAVALLLVLWPAAVQWLAQE